MTKVFSIENEKGGVGKTTTAVTTAVAVARYLQQGLQQGLQQKGGGKVLLINTDPQNDVVLPLGFDRAQFTSQFGDMCLGNVLVNPETLADNIVDLGTHSPMKHQNLFFLPASRSLASTISQIVGDFGAMKDIAQKMTAHGRRQAGLDKLPDEPEEYLAQVFYESFGIIKEQGPFEYIFIDTAPGIGALRLAIHKFADYAIVPVRPEFQSVSQTGEHTRTLDNDRTRYGLGIRLLAVVPTFVQSNLKLTQEMVGQLKETYKQLLTPPIPLTTSISKGPALGGLTVFDQAAESATANQAAKAYYSLVHRVLSV